MEHILLAMCEIEDFDLTAAVVDGETTEQTAARLMKGEYAKYSWTTIKRA